VGSGPQAATFTLHITDNITGFDTASFWLHSPSGQQVRGQTWAYPNNLVSGGPLDGVYDVAVTFPLYSEVGTWSVFYANINDTRGNETTLSEADLIALGFPTKLQVVSGLPPNQPPTISNASTSPSVLWPPNKKMVGVTVNYDVADDFTPSANIACSLSVASNEPIGNSDYAIVDSHHVSLRADRLGSGHGRIYTITITCKDTAGESSSQAVTVSVPHDQGKK
jgi:hypothetical protein